MGDSTDRLEEHQARFRCHVCGVASAGPFRPEGEGDIALTTPSVIPSGSEESRRGADERDVEPRSHPPEPPSTGGGSLLRRDDTPCAGRTRPEDEAAFDWDIPRDLVRCEECQRWACLTHIKNMGFESWWTCILCYHQHLARIEAELRQTAS